MTQREATEQYVWPFIKNKTRQDHIESFIAESKRKTLNRKTKLRWK